MLAYLHSMTLFISSLKIDYVPDANATENQPVFIRYSRTTSDGVLLDWPIPAHGTMTPPPPPHTHHPRHRPLSLYMTKLIFE